MVCLSKFNICELPKELLEKIFVFLNADSVEAAEKVCTMWETLILTSILVWKSQIVQLCSEKSQYKKSIMSSKIYTDAKTDPANLKSLYYHMAKIEQNMDNNKYDVITLDCFEAAKKKIRKVEAMHFIDPFLMIRSDNRLLVSRYDTFQVWDLDSYECMQVIHDSVEYDAKGSMIIIRSLALHGDTIFSGYNNGLIKLVDLQTERIVAKVWKNSNSITEMAVKDEILVTLDHYGVIIVWNWFSEQPGQIVQIHAQEKFVRPKDFNRLWTKYELLAYSGDHLVTTIRQVDDGLSHLIYYNNGGFVRSYPTKTAVHCISIQGSSLAFGGCSGNLGAMAGIFKLSQEGAPGILYLKIPTQRWIRSISFFDKFLILDTKGQLHMVDISQIQFPPPGIKHEAELVEDGFGVKYIRSLTTNTNNMGDIGVDSYRMFFEAWSNGTIFVHDYMKYHNALKLKANAQKLENLYKANAQTLKNLLPKIVELVTDALCNLKDFNGSKMYYIIKYIVANYDVSCPSRQMMVALVSMGLEEGITDGIFKRVKGSKYKLVVAAKKKKEPKAKKPIVKKNKKVLVSKTIKPAKKSSAKSVNKSKTKKVTKKPTKKMAAKKSTTVKVTAKKSTTEKELLRQPLLEKIKSRIMFTFEKN